MRFFWLLLLFLLVNSAFRLPFLETFWYLNEDAALLHGARDSVTQHGVFHWFTHSYGPKIIRPWQLLSFAFDSTFFFPEAVFSHLQQIVFLSLGQALLAVTLIPHFGMGFILLALIPLGTARAAAESTLWLSDRHDLFLLCFGALALLSVDRFWRPQNSFLRSLGYLLGMLLCLWGALYSNEKATMLAMLFPLYCVALSVIEEKTLLSTVVSRRFLALSFFCGSALVLYFLLRWTVLGELIGGYSSSLTPKGGLSFQFLSHWLLGLLGTPFWQATGKLFWPGFLTSWFLMLLCLAVATWSAFSEGRGKRFILGCLVAFAAVVLSSLPTAQYSLQIDHGGVFSTRMHWLPVVVFWISAGILASQLWRQSATSPLTRLLLVGTALLVTGVSSWGGRAAVRQVSAASLFSRSAFEQFGAYCGCAAPENPQSTGLPMHFRTVNVFTDATWLEQTALAFGFPNCKTLPEAERCEIRFRLRDIPEPQVIPRIVSQSVLDRIGYPQQVNAEPECFAITKALASSETTLRLRGRRRPECKTSETDRIVVFSDHKAIAFSSFNVPSRGKQADTQEQERSFLMELPAASLPCGEHLFEIIVISNGVGYRIDEREGTLRECDLLSTSLVAPQGH